MRGEKKKKIEKVEEKVAEKVAGVLVKISQIVVHGHLARTMWAAPDGSSTPHDDHATRGGTLYSIAVPSPDDGTLTTARIQFCHPEFNFDGKDSNKSPIFRQNLDLPTGFNSRR